MAQPGIEGHPDGDEVTVTYEQLLACREALIQQAKAQRMITLAELFDRLKAQFAELPVRRLPDTVTSDWLVWMYGMLQLVCQDCARRGEPLLPALVTKDDGEVW